MPSEVTYTELFAYLKKLGFTDSSRSRFERIFEHSPSGIFLAFAMLDDPAENRPARPADILSAEIRLQQHGLLVGNLTDAAGPLRKIIR
jgi:hypothetical protein